MIDFCLSAGSFEIYIVSPHPDAVYIAGMNIYAAIFLIPFSVVLYTCTGGLKVEASTIIDLNIHCTSLVHFYTAKEPW